jgi:hypothetical protein
LPDFPLPSCLAQIDPSRYPRTATQFQDNGESR